MATFKHILVPTDFGDASEQAVSIALDIASKFEAKVTLLHATWLPPYYYSAYAEGLAWPTDELDAQANKQLDATVAKAKARYPYVDKVLIAGEAWQGILETASERAADLIVMGTHGRRGLSRIFLGSVAEKVVRMSPVPVMTVSAEAERIGRAKAVAESARR
jgi:nucleotide-binding universal stress UspA family protein